MLTVFYARVSTADQAAEHQVTQAREAGFKIDIVVSDVGVSGVSTKLRDRPSGKRLFDILRPGDTLVVRWVDRLGRNYIDVTEAIREFMLMGVVIKTVINSMVFDGSTADPMQLALRDTLISFLAATAQAQVEASKLAQEAGIAHARIAGKRYLGRKPSYTSEIVRDALIMQSEGVSKCEIARELGINRSAVQRILADPERAEQAIARWHDPLIVRGAAPLTKAERMSTQKG